MAGTGVIFGLMSSYLVLLVAAFFGTLGMSASETAPFLPIDQAMLTQAGLPLASGIRLLFGVYAALALVVAGLSLRLSSPVEAPLHAPVQVTSI